MGIGLELYDANKWAEDDDVLKEAFERRQVRVSVCLCVYVCVSVSVCVCVCVCVCV
jgi:hypothetical protein